MKKVLLIVNNATKYQSLIQALSSKTIDISICSYHNLAFYINEEETDISCYPTGTSLCEFSKIIVLSTSPSHLQNYIFSALACYCRKNHIELIDDSFSNLDGKLYALWRFWEKDIPVAKTAFGPTDFLVSKLASFDGAGILKSVKGTKGKDNFLVHSGSELHQIIAENPNVDFVLQDFIVNSGDWRIILIDFEPKLAIFRSSHGKDHRNNTSVGGEAKLVPLEQVDPEVLRLAIDAAKSLNIRIAGADILPSKTGDYTVLEVNRTPQLVTGSFTDSKSEVLRGLIYN